MTRATRSRERATHETRNDGGERYRSAFARVRLVRAWIAAAAALVAVLSAYVTLWERVVR